MKRFCLDLGLVGCLAMAAPAMAAAPRLSAASVEDAGFTPLPDKPSTTIVPEVVKAEVMLARAHVSPGSIDGIDGDNFSKALAAYQRQSSLPETGRLDRATWDKLSGDHAPVMRRYTITAADAAGPFTRIIPVQFEAQSRLKRLGYRDLKEALAERFHMNIALLVGLNRNRPMRAGRAIDVVAADAPDARRTPARIVVDKSGHAVEAFGGGRHACWPSIRPRSAATEKPAPSGAVRDPPHRPPPGLYLHAAICLQGRRIEDALHASRPAPTTRSARVWMDLSYEGYGIHGTPNPEAIGKTQSHGCIRLTNWDVENLAAMTEAGTPVFFQDGAADPQPVPPATPVAGAGDAGTAAPSADPAPVAK